ncbi:hypothetical protein V6N13_127818 [Hibiscus sabdariffa]|uniref:Uncharacterized protein n=1 Tax=Hibiscus sabdariffa TaxID=183260 RepID=A0ABR2CEM2_9ROSI
MFISGSPGHISQNEWNSKIDGENVMVSRNPGSRRCGLTMRFGHCFWGSSIGGPLHIDCNAYELTTCCISFAFRHTDKTGFWFLILLQIWPLIAYHLLSNKLDKTSN